LAQAFAIQQQQQQQQRALAAIQQNIHTANPFLQALTLQNIAQTFMLNPTNDNLQRPRFFCYLCFKVFQSQSQYTIHYFLFRDNANLPEQLFEPNQLTEEPTASNTTNHCEQCENNRQKIKELEQTLELTRLELRNTQQLMERISTMAGSLLESCTSFDKQWHMQSRKVYSQLESVFYKIE
uniref:C2H2-type domain-containing protein n=1 Tax=Dracunculus medinensis TaxID=318479 RepID=A0A0N4UKR5_DRAME